MTGFFLALALHAATLGSAVAATKILPLSDLVPGAGYVSAVEALVQARVVTGYRDEDGKYTGLFRPNDKATIAEVLKWSLLAARQPFPPARVPNNVSAQGTWASGYVSAAELRHFMVFKDNLLNVHRAATRAEVVQTIADAFRLSPQKISTNRDASTMSRMEVAVLLARLLPFAPSSAVNASPSSSSSSSAPSAPAPSTPVPVLPTTHRLATTSANLRTGPSTKYHIIRVLHQNEPLTLLLEPNELWGEVELSDGTKGFLTLSAIARTQLESTPTTGAVTGVVIDRPINVRTRADATSIAIDSLPVGTSLTILDQSNPNWLRVRLQDEREGFVAAKYVKIGN